MKRALLIGFAACAFALAPTLSASAMPVTTSNTLIGGSDSAVIQIHGHHYGWGLGHHYGWRHHHR